METKTHISLETENQVLKNLLVTQVQAKGREEWYDTVDILTIFHISTSTIKRYRKKNEIPHTKVGGRYFYPKNGINELLLSRMKGSG